MTDKTNEQALPEWIVQAVARGWCSQENSHKIMDPDLAFAIAAEVSQALASRPAETGERGVGESPYGYCPTCGAKGAMRERRPGGNDKCANGHTYPSRDALRAQPAGGGEDWQARALAAEADIERMTDAFNRENGPTFMGEPVLPPEKMVELEEGVQVPKWLLDHTRRIELYMKANLPGPWRIGGIQSYDYKKEIGHE